MAEDKKTREHKTTEKSGSVIPFILDKLFGTVESFAERLLDAVNETADDLVNRSVQKLFVLLLLGMGIVFLLSGGAQVINQIYELPGIGQMIIGLFILLVTSIFLLVSRRR